MQTFFAPLHWESFSDFQDDTYLSRVLLLFGLLKSYFSFTSLTDTDFFDRPLSHHQVALMMDDIRTGSGAITGQDKNQTA